MGSLLAPLRTHNMANKGDWWIPIAMNWELHGRREQYRVALPDDRSGKGTFEEEKKCYCPKVNAFVKGLYDLGVARAAVDAARLRLKLMGAKRVRSRSKPNTSDATRRALKLPRRVRRSAFFLSGFSSGDAIHAVIGSKDQSSSRAAPGDNKQPVPLP